MRYPIDLVSPTVAFGAEVKIGVQLGVEPPPLEIPDCPNCPPGCEVLCYGWQMARFGAVGTGGYPYTDVQIADGPSVFAAYPSAFTAEEYLVHYGITYQREGFLFVPVGEFCGHKLRLVVDEGSWDTHTLIYSNTATLTPSAMLLFNTISIGSGNTGTIKAQIDLTDAALGSETWTDICGTIRVTAAEGV